LKAEEFTKAHSGENSSQKERVQLQVILRLRQHLLNLGGCRRHDFLRVRLRRSFLAEATEFAGRVWGDKAFPDSMAEHLTQRRHDVPHRRFRETGIDLRRNQSTDIRSHNLIAESRSQMLLDNLRVQAVSRELAMDFCIRRKPLRRPGG
jgi:hypothetical protein